MIARARRTLRVAGVVQGVGFRPFVHRLARECEVAGFVRNDVTHVHIEVEGSPERLDRFCRHLVVDAPPLARIDDVTAGEAPCRFEADFRITESGLVVDDRTAPLIPPDVAMCAECRRELFDPADRRYRHPFITCTNCGPRFTIIGSLPYDRANTTMAAFDMCDRCRVEYEDPENRRHHAQPIACHDCGPGLRYERAGRVTIGTDGVLTAVIADLEAGRIVAVKGIGGFHLAVDATDDGAVRRLRDRKRRADKPFAVMVRDLDLVRRVAHVSPAEISALEAPARPIVLVRSRADSPLSPSVAPGNAYVGLFLPYSPLHELLFAPVRGGDASPPGALVMTSGNLSEDPIAYKDEDARARLSDIADGFCLHDRPIAAPCDDSVVRIVDDVELPIRRSRGFAPLPVPLPRPVRPTLAVGGELKNVVALASGRTAWLSQHLGDMENLETLRAMESAIDTFARMTDVQPDRVVADRHPGYRTRRWARARTGLGFCDVQHHHAHLASLMAEHGLDGRASVLGFVFDGTGYGDDGSSWGGEVMIGDYSGFERWGHLAAIEMPGGDSAARNPYRSALAHLRAAGIDWHEELPPVRACEPNELRVIGHQLEHSIHCVRSTSMGRLFDAVASLLGLRHRISYEAQAAIELESFAVGVDREVPMQIAVTATGALDPGPALRTIVEGVRCEADRAALALGFHLAVVDAVVESAVAVRAARGTDVVGLTGGVFQNELLGRHAAHRLRDEGFTVLTHRLVPPNDAGIALGQTMIAADRAGDL